MLHRGDTTRRERIIPQEAIGHIEAVGNNERPALIAGLIYSVFSQFTGFQALSKLPVGDCLCKLKSLVECPRSCGTPLIRGFLTCLKA